MTRDPNIDRAVSIPRLGHWRRALLLLLVFLIAELTAGKACADVLGLMIYQVRAFDGKKWHTQKLEPGTCLTCTKAEWKFLTGTDWPDKVKVEVFWRWTLESVCNGCSATAFRDGSTSGTATFTSVDGFQGKIFTYENQPKHSTFEASVKVGGTSEEIVSPKTKITLKVVPVFKFPWVEIVAPAEGETFQAGPSTLIVVKSFLPKKPPATVRLEVNKKVNGKWTWAAPGTTDFPWASSPYNLPASTGQYRIRVQGKKGATTGIYSPWRTFNVQ
jgi:hypothetical protein